MDPRPREGLHQRSCRRSLRAVSLAGFGVPTSVKPWAGAQMLQRPVVAVFVAVLAPTIAFLALYAWGGAMDRRETLGRATLARASQVMERIDGELAADARSLEILASSPLLDAREFGRFRIFMQRARAVHTDWAALTIVGVEGEIILFEGDAAELASQIERVQVQGLTSSSGDIQPA